MLQSCFSCYFSRPSTLLLHVTTSIVLELGGGVGGVEVRGIGVGGLETGIGVGGFGVGGVESGVGVGGGGVGVGELRSEGCSWFEITLKVL